MTNKTKKRLNDLAEYGKKLVDEDAGTVRFRHYKKDGDNKLSKFNDYDPKTYGGVSK